MGTNYYYKPPNIGYRVTPPIHIGKNSCGWKFLFHINNTIKCAEDWFKILESESGTITSEYGENISFNEFKKIVNSKTHLKSQGKGIFYGIEYFTDGKYDYTEGDFF